jgi:hypothetical protein
MVNRAADRRASFPAVALRCRRRGAFVAWPVPRVLPGCFSVLPVLPTALVVVLRLGRLDLLGPGVRMRVIRQLDA